MQERPDNAPRQLVEVGGGNEIKLTADAKAKFGLKAADFEKSFGQVNAKLKEITDEMFKMDDELSPEAARRVAQETANAINEIYQDGMSDISREKYYLSFKDLLVGQHLDGLIATVQTEVPKIMNKNIDFALKNEDLVDFLVNLDENLAELKPEDRQFIKDAMIYSGLTDLQVAKEITSEDFFGGRSIALARLNGFKQNYRSVIDDNKRDFDAVASL